MYDKCLLCCNVCVAAINYNWLICWIRSGIHLIHHSVSYSDPRNLKRNNTSNSILSSPQTGIQSTYFYVHVAIQMGDVWIKSDRMLLRVLSMSKAATSFIQKLLILVSVFQEQNPERWVFVASYWSQTKGNIWCIWILNFN